MSAFAVLSLVQAVAVSGPIVSEVRALSPKRAGDLVLAGREHGEVVTVEAVAEVGPAPPGSVELDLVEAARSENGACVRRRWRANFRHGPGATRDAARFTDAYAVQEVALSERGGCARAGFAHVNPGLPTAAAVESLARLRRIATGRERVKIACASPFDPRLCADRRATLARIAAEPVWAMPGRAGGVELWLGRRGEAPIIVGLHAAGPDRITVSREAPAPF